MSDITPADLRWLDAAARIAMPFRGTTAENPTVGAIVVSPQGIMRGRGVTAPGGRPHAEPIALAMAGERAHDATLYVTLEPCNHWGKTPPCVDAVIASGVTRLVCGTTDPDPRTAGRSLEKLREAGIEVLLADHHKSSLRLHEGFFTRMTLGRPFVTAKLAISRDGMIGLPDRGNVPITGNIARTWTHMQRALSDAVMVGGSTAILDNPRLSVRLPGLENRKPLRVFILGRSQMNQIGDLSRQGAVFITQNDALESVSQDADIIAVPTEQERPALQPTLTALGNRGISALLVEGGAALTESLLTQGLVDRFHLLESEIEIGAGGVRATVHRSLPERLTALGFTIVDRAALGCDRLTTFEKI